MQESASGDDGNDGNSLTVFEFWAAGHVSNYLRLVLNHWQEHGKGRLTAVVTQRLVDFSPSLFAAFPDVPGAKVRWRTLDREDEALLDAARFEVDKPAGVESQLPPGFGQSGLFFFWGLMEKYAARYPARHFLFMHLDEHVYALAAGKPAPGNLSGLFILPEVPYTKDAKGAAAQFRRFTALQRPRLIERMLNHPQLRTVFFLDDAAAGRWNGVGSARTARIVDPVETSVPAFGPADIRETRRRFGIKDGQRLLLLFGAIAPRKGLWNLLAALERLGEEDRRRMCLAIVGNADQPVEAMLAPRLADVANRLNIACVRENRFVDMDELHAWFAASDVLLATYLRHTGPSNVLLHAAMHGRPVLSQDYGLLGSLVRDHGLGMTVDTEDIGALAAALETVIREASVPGFDAARARAYAREQSPERFTGVIFDAIMPFIDGRREA